MFALIDCNNFYASCERIFNPHLENKAVVVLSNNDGCVIARSEEAKKLGITMGQPYFEIKKMVENNLLYVASSNFSLYGDISQRVMTILHYFIDEIEIYSIDEAFLDLSKIKNSDLTAFCLEIRKTIKQWVGIPVSIGIGSSKTLAKAASKVAKKQTQFAGVVNFIDNPKTDELLNSIAVDDIWGVGRQYGKFLKNFSIKTALDFKKLPPDWVKNTMTISGWRTWQEINGQSLIELDDNPQKPKTVSCSRSFKKPIRKFSEINQLVSSYVAKAAEKLRQDKLLASEIMVYILTNRFDRENFSCKTIKIKLPKPTAFTPQLISGATKALEKIFTEGLEYKKAGIVLCRLVDKNCVQSDLFTDEKKEYKKERLMRCLDNLNNRFGNNTVRLTAECFLGVSFLEQNFKSPSFTTNWQELPLVKAK